MSIIIKNKRTYQSIGEYIGRPSPLGNPFVIGRDGTRDEVVAKYRKWLINEWFTHQNGEPALELRRLIDEYTLNNELTLICWCAPQLCHGDVLRQAILHEAI